MGAGKSAVGRQVASVLNFEFLDTDQVIEALAGKPIRLIFEQEGEPAFRAMERQVVAELAERTKTVISTGGGLPIDPGNMDSLKAHSLVVCLWASPETIFSRVKGHGHRPLLNEPDPMGKIRDLLAVRGPYYRQADVLVSTEMRTVQEVATQVVHHFHMAQAVHR